MFIRAKVTGYDNSLSLDAVQKEIEEYFSACGSFVYPHKTSARTTKMFASSSSQFSC